MKAKLYKENIKIAWNAVKTQILRTSLTVLIIAIGITALVGILTVVSALEFTISKNFASMGANTFTINQYEGNARNNQFGTREVINPVISYADVVAFKERYPFPNAQTSVWFTASGTAEVKHGIEKTDPEITIMGVDDHFIDNSGLEISKGRNLSSFDVQNNAYVCLVGSDMEKGLLKDSPVLGEMISIRGAKFKVIGILKEKGSTFGNKQDLRVYIPITLGRSLYSSPKINYTLSVMIAKKELIGEAIDQAIVSMRNIRKLPPVRDNNFGIIRSDDLINKILGITEYLQIASFAIGIITILGSSIALMNIMIVSVTERTREIGVRKSLGAKKNTIAWQFFIETLVIGQLGGIIGIIFGIAIGFGVSTMLEFKFTIPWLAIFSAFITSFLVAIVSGLYPAIKASKLDPIEALRYE